MDFSNELLRNLSSFHFWSQSQKVCETHKLINLKYISWLSEYYLDFKILGWEMCQKRKKKNYLELKSPQN